MPYAAFIVIRAANLFEQGKRLQNNEYRMEILTVLQHRGIILAWLSAFGEIHGMLVHGDLQTCWQIVARSLHEMLDACPSSALRVVQVWESNPFRHCLILWVKYAGKTHRKNIYISLAMINLGLHTHTSSEYIPKRTTEPHTYHCILGIVYHRGWWRPQECWLL